MSQFKLGIQMFVKDMRESLPLGVTFVIAVIAFFLAFAVASGFHF